MILVREFSDGEHLHGIHQTVVNIRRGVKSCNKILLCACDRATELMNNFSNAETATWF